MPNYYTFDIAFWLKIFALLLLGFTALHRQYALFCGDCDFVGRETRDRQRDLVAVFAQTLEHLASQHSRRRRKPSAS